MRGAKRGLAAGWLLAVSPLAWCHAVLVEGNPQSGASVAGPTVPVTLRFNSRIDGKRCRLTATGADGKETVLTMLPQTAPDTIASELKGARRGRCRIRWQVLASDGHITGGQLVFQVQ